MKKKTLIIGTITLLAATCLTACGEKPIISVDIESSPTKSVYHVGEKLDATGLKLLVTFDDKSKEVVDKDYTIKDSDVPFTKEDASKGTKEFLVEYKNFKTQFTVTIENIVTSISVKAPTKVKYNAGEKLDLTGMNVTATMSDGTSKDVTSECVTNPSTNIPLQKGLASVMVTHSASGKQTSFAITVGDAVVSSLQLTNPLKTTYKEGEKLDLTGMKVIATLTDKSTVEVTSECSTNPDVNTPLTTDIKKVVVTHASSKKSVEFNIDVAPLEVTSIEIKSMPTKTDYILNETFNSDGLKVIAHYEDKSTKEITDYTLDISSEYKFSEADIKAGKKTITVTYKGKEATFDVETWLKASNSNELASCLNSVNNGETVKILLDQNSDGYTIYGLIGGTLGVGKTITLKGIPTQKVNYYVGTEKDLGGQNNGDWSFAQSNVTFENINFIFKGGVHYFQGFADASNLTFKKCSFDGIGSFWGTGKAYFFDCYFKMDINNDEYNIVTYSGKDFLFDNCHFYSTARNVNAYAQSGVNYRYTMKFKTCTFERKNRFSELCPAVRLKDNPLDGTPVDLYFIGEQKLINVDVSEQTNSDLFEVKLTSDYKATYPEKVYYSSIYIDDVLVWDFGEPVNQ